MSDGIVNLCDSLQCKWFVTRLEAVEYALKHGSIHLSEYEREFVEDMREKFDGREDDVDMGVTAWSPTRKQYNMLDQIFLGIGK